MMRLLKRHYKQATMLFCSAVLLSSCNYEPEKMTQPTLGDEQDTVAQSGVLPGSLFPVNTNKQTCNPAISQDTVNFPGALLWLGFDGDFIINEAPDGYSTSGIKQHDRLTISNTENGVDWFMMKDEIPWMNCEFQDPEWAAHPEYLVSLGGYKEAEGNCSDKIKYSGIVIRPEDKASFKWKEELIGTSTPHVWIDPTVAADTSLRVDGDSITYDSNGLASVEDVEAFFGTRNVKFVYSDKPEGAKKLELFFVDYSAGAPKPVALKRPDSDQDMDTESAMFSYDGEWITYNAWIAPAIGPYFAYAQKVNSSAAPILVSKNATDPHWYVNASGETFISYVTVPDGRSYKVLEDLTDATLQESGSAGYTAWRKVNFGSPVDALGAGAIGEEELLVAVPMKGGISPDGKYMGTGTNNAYILELQ